VGNGKDLKIWWQLFTKKPRHPAPAERHSSWSPTIAALSEAQSSPDFVIVLPLLYALRDRMHDEAHLSLWNPRAVSSVRHCLVLIRHSRSLITRYQWRRQFTPQQPPTSTPRKRYSTPIFLLPRFYVINIQRNEKNRTFTSIQPPRPIIDASTNTDTDRAPGVKQS